MKNDQVISTCSRAPALEHTGRRLSLLHFISVFLNVLARNPLCTTHFFVTPMSSSHG